MKIIHFFLPAALLAAFICHGATPTVTELHVFPVGPNGTFPDGGTPGPILQASDGNFYGVTAQFGDDDTHCKKHHCAGTIFKLTPAGNFTVLHTFVYGDPNAPYADGAGPVGLVEGPDGNLYGTTSAGGNETEGSFEGGYGTVFRISKTGAFKSLHKFCHSGACEEGSRPSSLVLGRDGNFYGTTEASSPSHPSAKGTIFRVSTSGTVETLHNFDPLPEGYAPLAGLVQASDGNFYGVTSGAGSSQYAVGTLFRITPKGDFKILYTFQLEPSPKDGHAPRHPLIQACHGKLYGVTSGGGLFQQGTLFEMSLDGHYKTLLNFGDEVSGREANALLLATDGNLWSSFMVSMNPFFTVTTSGSVKQTFPFLGRSCGPNGPTSQLTQGTDGKLYGTSTSCGVLDNGASGAGSVFRVDAGLPKPPLPLIGAIGNAASYAQGGIVPGEIASLFGTELTTKDGVHIASLPLSTDYQNVSVFVNGIPVPLFAVVGGNGQQQINFQVPFEVAGHTKATITVENNCHSSATLTVPVLDAQPGVFSYVSSGVTFGAVLHANYHYADAAHPAKQGETVIMYANGLGAVVNPPKDGAQSNGERTVALPEISVGGKTAKLRFSGLAPGFIGVNQINFDVPKGLAPGNQPLVVSMNGIASPTVMLPVE